MWVGWWGSYVPRFARLHSAVDGQGDNAIEPNERDMRWRNRGTAQRMIVWGEREVAGTIKN